MAPGEGLSNEDIYMASWYDDLLKRQEYQYRQGQPTYKPNSFQEMFTPKGMEYQWQAPLDEGGGEYTGYTPGGYEGDTETLRMVKPPSLSVATPTVPDGTQANQGGVDEGVGGVTNWPLVGPEQLALVRPGITNDQLKRGARRIPILGKRMFPGGDTVKGPAAVPSTDWDVARARLAEAKASLGGTKPFVGPPEPAPGMRGSRLPGPPTRPTGAGLEFDPKFSARPEPPRVPMARAAAGMAEPFVPATKYGPGGYGGGPRTKPFVGPPRPPITEVPFVGPPRPPVTEAPFVGPPRPPATEPFVGPPRPPLSTTTPTPGVGNFFREGFMGRNIPAHWLAKGAEAWGLGNKWKGGAWKGLGAAGKALGPAAWGLTGWDLLSAGHGGLGSGRTGVVNQAYGGDELVEINAQRAMQGLPPIMGEGAGGGGLQDPTEYFIDARNYGNDNWVNPASYWWDKMPWNNPSPITSTRPPRTRTRR